MSDLNALPGPSWAVRDDFQAVAIGGHEMSFLLAASLGYGLFEILRLLLPGIWDIDM